MWNIVRIIVYIGLVAIGGRYRYQNPNRYQFKSADDSTGTVITIPTWDAPSADSPLPYNITSWQTNSWDNIVDQIAQQLSGEEESGVRLNPFGESYITISEQPQITQPEPDTSTCTTPRGRTIVAWDYTLAFQSAQAVNNVCVFEKRICSQWLLGWSYDQHTCYFGQHGWWYEYLGQTGTDSTQLIQETEIMLGIYNTQPNNNERVVQSEVNTHKAVFQDDTQWVSNYNLIDSSYNTNKATSYDQTTSQWSNTQSTTQVTSAELWAINPRAPEVKISAARDQQINPNGNGIQWGTINNQGNKPSRSYSTNNVRLESTYTPPTNRDCRSPRGTQVFHNQHVLAFEQTSVPQWQQCKSELRTCTFGYLRWSYTQQTCTIEGATNTDTNNPYAPTRPYYNNGTYYNYDYYDAQWNYNNRWYDDRYYERYNYSYTSPRKAYQNCVADHYGFVGHGSTLTMYEKSEVWPGEVCRSSVRTCDDGTLSGPSTYQYGSCKTVANPKKTPIKTTTTTKPTQTTTQVSRSNTTTISYDYYNTKGCYDIRFGLISHGSSVKMYKQSSVAYNQSCDYEYRTCSNGVLLWSYLNETCNVRWRTNEVTYNGVNVYRYDDRYKDNYYTQLYYQSWWNSCTIPNYGILDHGKSLVMYRETHPKAGSRCDATVRTCVNGVLDGVSEYNSRTCKETLIPSSINYVCQDYSTDRYVCKWQYRWTKSDACGQLRICTR